MSRRERRTYGARGKHDASRSFLRKAPVAAPKAAPKVSPTAIKGLVVETLPCGTVKTMTWDDDLCQPVYHYIKPEGVAETPGKKAARSPRGRARAGKENNDDNKKKKNDVSTPTAPRAGGGSVKKRKTRSASKSAKEGKRRRSTDAPTPRKLRLSGDSSGSDEASAAREKHRRKTAPARLPGGGGKRRRAFGSRNKNGRSFIDSEMDIDALDSIYRFSGGAAAVVSTEKAAPVLRTPVKSKPSEENQNSSRTPRKSPRLVKAEDSVNGVVANESSFKTPTPRKKKLMQEKKDQIPTPIQPNCSASIEKLRAYFEDLDNTHTLIVASDEELKTPHWKPTKTRRQMRLSDPQLTQDYDAYRSAMTGANVTPLPIKVFGKNRSFFRKGELFDGFLDE